jgi:cytochrome c oxidase cbb3-type subunit I/II
MTMLGVPYGTAVTNAESLAREQAASIAADISQNGGPANLQDQTVVALVAYIQRLGQDIKLANAAAQVSATTTPPAAVAGVTP